MYLTQLELSHDKADPHRKDEYTCLLLYAWYCTLKTFPERNAKKGAPTIEVSREVFDSLNDFILDTNPAAGSCKTQTRIETPQARAVFAELVRMGAFTYSFEVGAKVIELSQALQPKQIRPQFDLE